MESYISCCAWCGRIKEKGNWLFPEEKLDEKKLTHGCCPHCLREHYPNIAEKIIEETLSI